jgi:DNA-binding transcriptional LysR family regulator
MAVRIGKLPDSSMVATRIGTMRTVTCGSPGLLAKQGIPKSPVALSSYPCIALHASLASPTWQFRNPKGKTTIDVSIRPRLTVTTSEAAASAAARGVGLARLLHYQAVEAIARDELRIVLQAFELEPAPVHLVHVSRGQMPLKLRRFLDFAAPLLVEAIHATNRLP